MSMPRSLINPPVFVIPCRRPSLRIDGDSFALVFFFEPLAGRLLRAHEVEFVMSGAFFERVQIAAIDWRGVRRKDGQIQIGSASGLAAGARTIDPDFAHLRKRWNALRKEAKSFSRSASGFMVTTTKWSESSGPFPNG